MMHSTLRLPQNLKWVFPVALTLTSLPAALYVLLPWRLPVLPQQVVSSVLTPYIAKASGGVSETTGPAQSSVNIQIKQGGRTIYRFDVDCETNRATFYRLNADRLGQPYVAASHLATKDCHHGRVIVSEAETSFVSDLQGLKLSPTPKVPARGSRVAEPIGDRQRLGL